MKCVPVHSSQHAYLIIFFEITSVQIYWQKYIKNIFAKINKKKNLVHNLLVD